VQATAWWVEPLILVACDPSDKDQQWQFDNRTGLLRNARGICVSAAPSNTRGTPVSMLACEEDDPFMKWWVGPLSVLSSSALADAQANSLYCFALMRPKSYEQGLLAMQFLRRVGIFLCSAFQVYSNASILIAPGLNTGVVRSNLTCTAGGEFNTALNLDIFLAVWAQVFHDQTFMRYDWTAKADPDTVFFPDRLRRLLAKHGETERGVYVNNCQFGLHGPLEVFSRNAVRSWEKGRQQCHDFFWKACSGDCLWGEDMFIDQCLNRVLKVRRVDEFKLLTEAHCAPPAGWDDCGDSSRVAFHPFKTPRAYLKCLLPAHGGSQ